MDSNPAAAEETSVWTDLVDIKEVEFLQEYFQESGDENNKNVIQRLIQGEGKQRWYRDTELQ